MTKKILSIIIVTLICFYSFCDSVICYKSAGMMMDGHYYNNETTPTYVYIHFSEDKSYCYEVDENGNTFPIDLFKPDFNNSPRLLGYDTYRYKETTEDGYYIYSTPSYYGYYTGEPDPTVIFNSDFSRINKPVYYLVHDWVLDFEYYKLTTTHIYEKSNPPKKEKKTTPFY